MKKKILFTIIFIILFALMCSSISNATGKILYATEYSNSNIISIDLTDIDSPVITTLTPNNILPEPIHAMEILGDTIYGYTCNGIFFKMPLATLIPEVIKTVASEDAGLIDLSYNKVNNKLYAVNNTGGACALYEVDISTGDLTKIANLNDISTEGVTFALAFAIDANGNAYIAEGHNDNLFSLNLTNGECTLIGNMGINVNYAQSFEFELSTNTLYWALYNPNVGDDEIRKVNVTDATSTFIANLNNQTNAIAFQNTFYKVQVAPNIENGTITVDKVAAFENETITITVALEEGYQLKNITGVTVAKINNTTYTFTMPDEDVTIDAEFELLYEEKTITETESNLDVTLKGMFSQNPKLVITKIEKGNAGYDSLISLIKEDGKVTIGSYDVSVVGGTYKGELELTFEVEEKYEKSTVKIYHRLASGEIETKVATVKDGKVTMTISELSPFMLATEEKDETPKTGITSEDKSNIGISVLSILLITALEIILKSKI